MAKGRAWSSCCRLTSSGGSTIRPFLLRCCFTPNMEASSSGSYCTPIRVSPDTSKPPVGASRCGGLTRAQGAQEKLSQQSFLPSVKTQANLAKPAWRLNRASRNTNLQLRECHSKSVRKNSGWIAPPTGSIITKAFLQLPSCRSQALKGSFCWMHVPSGMVRSLDIFCLR